MEQSDNKKMAKNLLEGKTCDNCYYKETAPGSHYCTFYKQLDSNPYLGTSFLPKENTCLKWKERNNIIFGNFMSTTKELNDTMKRDIRIWKKKN